METEQDSMEEEDMEIQYKQRLITINVRQNSCRIF